MKNLYKIEDELYVVSNNEDVSENCWIITSGKLVQVSYLLSDEVAKGFKVILTTNKLLINDGVQGIDDTFLDWFVKNPNCEEVEVINEQYTQNYHKDIWYNRHKIIIPKEEHMSYEDFRKNASNDLIIKFDTDCSKYSEDGNSDNYFYANCKFWENKLKEEPKFYVGQRVIVCNNLKTLITKIEDEKYYFLDEDANVMWDIESSLEPIIEPKQELHFMDGEEEEVECSRCGDIMSLTTDKKIYVCCNSECTNCYEEEPKQETLEEFIESYVNRIDRSEDGLVEQCLADGANWQAEKSYSEENMKLAFETGRNFQLTGENNFSELMKQFKK